MSSNRGVEAGGKPDSLKGFTGNLVFIYPHSETWGNIFGDLINPSELPLLLSVKTFRFGSKEEIGQLPVSL